MYFVNQCCNQLLKVSEEKFEALLHHVRDQIWLFIKDGFSNINPLRLHLEDNIIESCHDDASDLMHINWLRLFIEHLEHLVDKPRQLPCRP